MIEKNEKFPNAFEGILLAVALMLGEYLIGAALYDMHVLSSMSAIDAGGMVMVISNALIFTAVMEYKGLTYRELFHSSSSRAGPSLTLIVPAILLTVPMLVLVVSFSLELVVRLFPLSASQTEMFKEMGAGSVGSIVIACVLAPVLEEMLFRGIILRSFLLQYQRWISILGSALIFGAAHMNLYQFTAALMLGIFLGWLYQRSRSLLPCIVLHGVYNGTLLLLNHADARWAAEQGANRTALLLTAAVIVGAAGLSLLRRVLPAKE
jgi:membrane protease YdiL (CAAX protease family)